MVKNLLIVLFFFISSCQIPSGKRRIAQDGSDAFDEVYGTSGGKEVRLVYQGIIEHYEALSDEEKKKLAQATLKDFDGDNALLPLPRVLSEVEFGDLKKGVEQRGRALRAFLKDHYSGKRKYLQEGIVPETVINRIIKRAGEEDWDKYIKPSNLNFWYGPDVIRGPPTPDFPEGQFLVVEDNPSFIGGMGDLVRAREILDRYMPVYSKVTQSGTPNKFYERLIADYKKRGENYKGKTVVVQYITELTADNEEQRIRAMMEGAGIDVVFVDPYSQNKKWPKNGKRLTSKDGKLFIEKKTKNGNIKRSKVGYVVTNMNPQDLELSHPANRKYHILAEAEWELEQPKIKASYKKKLQELMKADPETGDIDYEAIVKLIKKESPYSNTFDKKLGVQGIFDAAASGAIGMTNGPGMEFVGDKEFYIYMEEFIRYYLGEEPILRNMDTGSFSRITKQGLEAVDKKALNKVAFDRSRYVIKDVLGRGGDAVWVGPKVTDEVWEEVLAKVEANPSRFIYQQFNALSTLSGFIGDIRLISDVHSRGVRVADIPWARVVGMDGDGKVNISANGFEATVLVRKMKSFGCYQLMRSLLVP